MKCKNTACNNEMDTTANGKKFCNPECRIEFNNCLRLKKKCKKSTHPPGSKCKCGESIPKHWIECKRCAYLDLTQKPMPYSGNVCFDGEASYSVRSSR